MQLFTRSAEVKLMQTFSSIRDQPSGWNAIHFHLSDLLEDYKSEYQVKIAINLIHDLLKSYEGGIFLMNDQSIIVLCFGVEKPLQNKLVFQLRYLYMDDPLAYTEGGQENSEFAALYDLKRSGGPEFAELCSLYMSRSMRKGVEQQVSEKPREKDMPRLSDEKPAVREKEKSGLSVSTLANVERDLQRADLGRAIRRQPVCAVLPDKTIRRVFDELYIHIAHLRQTLKQDVDFLSNRWLFKYLTHILDERMLELLRSHTGRYMGSPISINLNIETLLSSKFTEFDAALQPAMKVAVVVEVPVVDVFVDMNAFKVARDEAQKLGYRICLDGLTTTSFQSVSREKLGLDLIKVQWNADAASDLESPENRAMAAAVQEAGTNRVILCRCDDRSAVEYGHALGISLFQGRYLDNILDPTAKVAN